MRVDRFLADLGVAETDTDVSARLEAEAAAFLRAGGVLAWSDWIAMAPETRAAFAEAGRRIRTETAIMEGMIHAHPERAAEIVAAFHGGGDGTESAARLAATTAARLAVAALEGGRP
jgi:hypothetical protein